MVPENLKKQLALAVRSIHWSYAIFWSSAATQPRVLNWGEGYYNGDIKTRKTSQVIEHNSESEDIGLQRSEQLRELYASLTIAEASSQTKRPSASLSPEDLTDAEWFYLVCMSFVFNIGQCLPGSTLANGQPIWLCNAHSADNRVFCRSLLAKSASIQTVLCFPFLDGVIELGTTDLVLEDPGLVQQIRTTFLHSMEANGPNLSMNMRNKEGVACVAFDHDAYGLGLTPEVIGYELINVTSPNSSSNALQANQLADEMFTAERINVSASKVQSWQVMDDEFSNCVHNNSMNSSDCFSQTFASPEKIAFVPNGEQDLQVCKTTLEEDLQSDDNNHYQRLLSALLKRPDQLIMGLHFQNFRHESSFVIWKQQGPKGYQRPRGGTPQKLLKKVLFEVPGMHMDGLLASQDCKEGMNPEADEDCMNHILSERRRRAKLNERFSTLRSMVPTISKDDKVSILDNAIEYLRTLEKKVRKLEAQRELIELDTGTKRTPHQDMVERTSGNYCTNKTDNGKKSVSNKRKASEVEETGTRREINSEAIRESSNVNVTMCMSDNEVVIEIKCPLREGVLMETVEALSSLHLDCHSVQSSEADGTLYLTIKSKFRGPTVASVKRIRHTLQKAALKC